MDRIKTCTFLGLGLSTLAFIFGVIAEVKKAPTGTPVLGLGHVACEYQKDVTVPLGFLSIITLLLGVAASHMVVFSPYKGYPVKREILFKCTKVKVFFGVAEVVSVAAFVLTLWPTVSQLLILKQNIHQDMTTQCPTAKTGLIGGGGMMSLNAALMWLVVFMVSDNRKTDLMEEEYENHYDASLDSFDDPYLGH